MKISKRIEEISKQPGFLFWIALADSNQNIEVSRCLPFSVFQDKQKVTAYVSSDMEIHLRKFLEVDVRISLLMASLSTFESYQIKGVLSEVGSVDESKIKQQIKVLKNTIEVANEQNISGDKTLGYLLNPPFTSLDIECLEIFEQTPKKGTGEKLDDANEK